MLLQLDLSHNELGAWDKAVLRLGMVKKALGGWARWLWIGSAMPFCC